MIYYLTARVSDFQFLTFFHSKILSMRYLLIIIISLPVLLSCQKDFDEVLDTDHKHINFTFNSSRMLDDILYQEPSFHLGHVSTIHPDYRLRITAYCYDFNDSLVCSNTIIGESAQLLSLKVRHLIEDNVYRFVFLADVVKYDPYIDFYEVWYQLGISSFSGMYIYSDYRENNPELNQLGYSFLEIIPDNQDVCVDFDSIVYNGYCVFRDFGNVESISGYISYTSRLRLDSMLPEKVSNLHTTFEFDKDALSTSSIIIPVTLCCADSIISVKLRRKLEFATDSVIAIIPNPGRDNFVATFSCSSLTLDDFKLY